MKRTFQMLAILLVSALLFAGANPNTPAAAAGPGMPMDMPMPGMPSQPAAPFLAAANTIFLSEVMSASSGASAPVQDVSIANFAFSPAAATVAVGTTVRWTNNDAFAHTVTADDGSFASGPLSPGATFEVTFKKAGTFTYHCSIHTSMKGSVTVTP